MHPKDQCKNWNNKDFVKRHGAKGNPKNTLNALTNTQRILIIAGPLSFGTPKMNDLKSVLQTQSLTWGM